MDEPLILDVDYYIENGQWVFTAHYLTKRGTCCRSGCRHCPYGFRHEDKKEKEERQEETPET
jgi:hypothetical protein